MYSKGNSSPPPKKVYCINSSLWVQILVLVWLLVVLELLNRVLVLGHNTLVLHKALALLTY